MSTDDLQPKCEICGAPAKEVLVNEVPVWYSYLPLCKQHAGPGHGGYRLLQAMDGRRMWVQVEQQCNDGPNLPKMPPGDWRDWS